MSRRLDTAQPRVLRSRVTLEFRILGPLEVSDETGHVALGGPKQRGLLAILVLEAGRVVATDRLIDLLWGEEAPKTATASLQNTVGRLRRALGADVLETRAPGYVLSVEPGSDRRTPRRAGAPRSAGGSRRTSGASGCRPRSRSGAVPRSPSSRSTTSRRRRSGGSTSCGSSSSRRGSTPISSSDDTAT